MVRRSKDRQERGAAGSAKNSVVVSSSVKNSSAVSVSAKNSAVMSSSAKNSAAVSGSVADSAVPSTSALTAAEELVIRRRVPRRCLWDACKAFTLGISLMIIGTGVAVVGYFNDQVVVTTPEGLDDWNVNHKNGTTTTVHLNNLAYVGPIIMGFGGFIIVIACVMTFEARDSAAKIAPSRPKTTQETPLSEENIETLERTLRTFQRMESRRSMRAQTPAKGKPQPSGSGVGRPPAPQGRRTLSGGIMQLSRTLADRFPSQRSHRWGRRLSSVNLNKSPSAPDLWEARPDVPMDEFSAAGRGGRRHGESSRPFAVWERRDNFNELFSMKSSRRLSKGIFDLDALSRKPSQRFSRKIIEIDTPLVSKPTPRLTKVFSESSAPLAHKSFQQDLDEICPFDALPVEPPRKQYKDYAADFDDASSQGSMALDLHDCQVTIKVRDETASKRSETARRHRLQRQRPVEEESPTALPKYPEFAKVVLPPTRGKSDAETTMSPELRSPVLRSTCNCCSEPGKPRKAKPKPKVEFRSKSFTQGTYYDPFEDEDTSKIFFVEDYPDAWICSTGRAPSFEKEKDPWNEGNKKKKKPFKVEGSLSADEEPTPRIRLGTQRRSSSFTSLEYARF